MFTLKDTLKEKKILTEIVIDNYEIMRYVWNVWNVDYVFLVILGIFIFKNNLRY